MTPNHRTHLLAAAAILAAVGCNNPPAQMTFGPEAKPSPVAGDLTTHPVVDPSNQPAPPSNEPAPPKKTSSGTMAAVFAPYSIMDSNMAAYTYLMPKGWKHDDSLQWVQGKLPYPVVKMAVKSPNDSHWLAVVPMLAGNSWSSPYGSGGVSFRNASQAIDTIATKTPGLSDYNVISESSTPAKTQWPEMRGEQSSHGTADVCVKRVSFTYKGKGYEAMYIGKLDTDEMRLGQQVSRLWHFGAQLIAAPKGQLTTDKIFMKQAATFLMSASITPEYNQLVNKISFDASQSARRVALQESERIVKDYWDRQGSQDRMNKNFDDYIRGVQDYGGGSGGPHSLPSGGHYWQDGEGNIGSSDDPNYDPNLDPNGGGGNWTPLKPVNG